VSVSFSYPMLNFLLSYSSVRETTCFGLRTSWTDQFGKVISNLPSCDSKQSKQGAITKSIDEAPETH